MTQEAPFPLVKIDDTRSIRFAMERLRLCEAGETIEHVERAGDGNMNLVLRVATNRRTVILKQSRPWVEKYPQIAAPADRILAEIDFYSRVSPYSRVSRWMPRLLASSAELFLIAIEDLGNASDYGELYSKRSVEAMPIDQATAWLAQLHSIPVDSRQRDQVGNRSLRVLNHQHIFVIPLHSPSAIPLDNICDSMERLASEVRRDAKIHDAAKSLGEIYLRGGECLLHGDFYPGSWLRTSDGLRVIDPEFCFSGPVEFDLGVLAAHRVMIGGADDSPEVIAEAYRSAGGVEMDHALLRRFAGIEVIRRLLGVAQLPLSANLQQRERMIRIATSLII